jgi:hypothetical protein
MSFVFFFFFFFLQRQACVNYCTRLTCTSVEHVADWETVPCVVTQEVEPPVDADDCLENWANSDGLVIRRQDSPARREFLRISLHR